MKGARPCTWLFRKALLAVVQFSMSMNTKAMETKSENSETPLHLALQHREKIAGDTPALGRRVPQRRRRSHEGRLHTFALCMQSAFVPIIPERRHASGVTVTTKCGKTPLDLVTSKAKPLLIS
jgi:hypothetical protein